MFPWFRLRFNFAMLSVCAGALTLLLSSQSTFSQARFSKTDPEYNQEVLRNTACSFIVTQDVNGRVAVRKTPSTNATIVTLLSRGTGVRALYRQGNWVRLAALSQGTSPRETFKPLEGWVYNRYINGCSEDQFERWRR